MSKFGGLVVDHLVDPPSVQDILGCQCHLRWKPLSKGPGFHPKHPLRKGLRLGEKDAKSLVGAHVVFDVFISTPVQSAVSRLARTIARRFSTFHRSVPEGCQWLSNPGTSHWEGCGRHLLHQMWCRRTSTPNFDRTPNFDLVRLSAGCQTDPKAQLLPDPTHSARQCHMLSPCGFHHGAFGTVHGARSSWGLQTFGQ